MDIETNVYNGVPRWLRVVPHVEGRLPGYAEGQPCWIRLDHIDRVEADACINIGNEDENEYGVRVFVREQSYYVLPALYKRNEADRLVESVLVAVGAAISR